jgi:hypothetical protein
MAPYSSKSALWTAICNTSAEIRSLQNTRDLLQAAYFSLVTIENQAFTCSTELSSWKDALNSSGSGFNWEGAQVCQTQELMSETIVEHSRFAFLCLQNKDAIWLKMLSIDDHIGTLQATKTNLTNQYNNWDASHR